MRQRRSPWVLVLAGAALAVSTLAAAQDVPATGAAPAADSAPVPKRVLLIHSFGRDFAPFDVATATFRRELALRSRTPVIFMEAALDATRALGPAEEAAFGAYLKARYSDPRPDLVVSVGGSAAMYLLAHRDRDFPGVPMLLSVVDARFAQRARMRPGDAMAATNVDPDQVFGNILYLRPGTRTVVLVIGNSSLEHIWERLVTDAAARYSGRLRLVSLGGLSLEEMTRRVASLPQDAAVLYTHVLVDGAGVPHERLEALAAIVNASTVPVFSTFGNEIGRGVVGGPYLDEIQAGHEAAVLAARQLAGSPAPEPVIERLDMAKPVYDARALARWGIPESRLPAGSTVRYQSVPIWVEHRKEFLVALAVVVVQALLIVALLIQSAMRRRAEQQAHTLGGRLITAHEDERRRLARELHDDVTQRLAGLSIEASALERGDDPSLRAAVAQSIGGELATLSRDVHALSYRLHPSVLDDLGLDEALRIECDRRSRTGEVEVDFECGVDTRAIRGDAALALFRVAQQALRNAIQHGKARHVIVRLQPDRQGVRLTVVDDGSGFDTSAVRARVSLGLASMRERVSLLGGRFRLRSARGAGTTITAWIPKAGPA